nr:beta-ketoacyl-ACP synthase III [Streptomyces indicus]
MERAPVVAGIGMCLPPRSVDNHEMSRELDTTHEWILSRTGIARRRRADAGTSTGDLAVGAAAGALASSGDAGADALVVATTTPDRRCPATGPEVAARLGLGEIPAFDVAAVCTGFLYGLTVASALIRSRTYHRVLVVGAETYSRIVDPLDRGTAVIFGDGAGAVLVRGGDPDEPGALLGTHLGSDGSGADLIAIAAGGARTPHPDPESGRELPREERYFSMRGRQVYGQAVHRMTACARVVLDRAGWAPGSLGAFVGHQANQRILDAVGDKLHIPAERRFGNIRDVGNTAAASIPLALADTAAAGRVRPGARTLLTAFGGGLTWGAATLTWPAAAPVACPPAVRPSTAAPTGRTVE